MEYLKSEFTNIEKDYIGETPIIRVTPKIERELHKTIIFYHGWGSNMTNQVFRGNILASYGYQVILPEAVHHGERGELDYEDMDVVYRYMPETLIGNIKEAPSILKGVVEKYGADPDSIVVGGHSLGAITAGALFTFSKNLHGLIMFNGVLDWNWFLKEITPPQGLTYEEERMHEFLYQINPMNYPENFGDRNMILFNGKEDEQISPEAQENFYKLVLPHFTNEKLINFEKFDRTHHQLTTQMLEKAIMHMKEYF